ncbi:hypothetical protein R52603_02109 [Paraburkholderia saeva]|nr:hypothetical protein [Paraburkholderia saeva]CAG4896010.1 hypothetical protein R52603_02109 [Paraburkholderia saeva]
MLLHPPVEQPRSTANGEQLRLPAYWQHALVVDHFFPLSKAALPSAPDKNLVRSPAGSLRRTLQQQAFEVVASIPWPGSDVIELLSQFDQRAFTPYRRKRYLCLERR